MIDKIKQIKYNRLSDEERFFIESIDGIKSFTSKKYPHSIFWEKDGIILIEHSYNNVYGWVYVNNKLIWSVIENKFCHTGKETRIFIKKMFLKYIDNTNVNIMTFAHNKHGLSDMGWDGLEKQRKSYKFKIVNKLKTKIKWL